MTYFACGRGNGKSAPEPDIAIGDKVARKNNRAIVGEVVQTFRATGGRLTAKVRWSHVSPARIKYFTYSSIAVATLVKIEGETK